MIRQYIKGTDFHQEGHALYAVVTLLCPLHSFGCEGEIRVSDLKMGGLREPTKFNWPSYQFIASERPFRGWDFKDESDFPSGHCSECGVRVTLLEEVANSLVPEAKKFWDNHLLQHQKARTPRNSR